MKPEPICVEPLSTYIAARGIPVTPPYGLEISSTCLGIHRTIRKPARSANTTSQSKRRSSLIK